MRGDPQPVTIGEIFAHRSMRTMMRGELTAAGEHLRKLRRSQRTTNLDLQDCALRPTVLLARETPFDDAFAWTDAAGKAQPTNALVRSEFLAITVMSGGHVAYDMIRNHVQSLPLEPNNWLWLAAVAESTTVADRLGHADLAAELHQLLHRFARWYRRDCKSERTSSAAWFFARRTRLNDSRKSSPGRALPRTRRGRAPPFGRDTVAHSFADRPRFDPFGNPVRRSSTRLVCSWWGHGARSRGLGAGRVRLGFGSAAPRRTFDRSGIGRPSTRRRR